MKIHLGIIALSLSLSGIVVAGKTSPARIIAKEPVTMMDLGILKLNSKLSRPWLRSLRDAKIGARYNRRSGTIEIKVSLPVKKASKTSCKKMVNNTRKLFVHPYVKGKKRTSNIAYYFKHEGTKYRNKINWNDLQNYVVISGVVITRKNYQHSVFCKGKLMSKKVTY